MTSGTELLARARAASSEDLDDLVGSGAGADGDTARAAIVAALLPNHTDADAPLIRALTRWEIDRVGRAGDGCGDVLLACCWLLFMLGDVTDSALIWQAKELNFDTHSYIDSVFLIPRGVRATAEFARTHGLHDLAAWMDNDWLGDPDEAAARWRQTSFFSRVPPASAPSAELAAWLRQE